ncbi:MAG: DEAD/DEAH box helicase, partial [Candidatus Eremiobacterota bacterium]
MSLLSERLQEGLARRLGWRSLRPVQELALAEVLAGRNTVILAPTAGGKTEAALLPVLEGLMRGQARPVGALFLSPLRALLNNQEPRVELLASLAGLTSFKWHGDVRASAKKRFRSEPAHLLLITPESLEGILSNPRSRAADLFQGLRYAVIDEIHAFVGDDRGDHLAALLERLTEFSPDFQRIGLSATVGNPEVLLEWLQGSSRREGVVVRPSREPSTRVVEILPLGADQDPGRVAGLLARGQKSLFFADSRKRAEYLKTRMDEAGIRTFVHHASLSREVREEGEQAFREGSNCSIVCTSTMELGLDVGDLDLVLQLGAPSTVSSFLQRFGRTGRRAGTRGRMAFLTDLEWEF